MWENREGKGLKMAGDSLCCVDACVCEHGGVSAATGLRPRV